MAVTVMTGCGGNSGGGGTPHVPTALTQSPSALSSDSHDSPAPVMSATETGLPTLPPGDPGTTSVPPRAHDPEHPPRSDVPANALLDPHTLGAVVGKSWRVVPAPSDSCSAPRPSGAIARRTTGLQASGGYLIETVAVHASEEAAERAIAQLARRLATCGWSPEQAPPLGDAARQMSRGQGHQTARVVAVAVEGVSVTLIATGPQLVAAETLEAVVDVAVSSSCPAAPHGCH